MAPSQDPVSTSGTGEATSSMAGGSPPTEKEWELIHKVTSNKVCLNSSKMWFTDFVPSSFSLDQELKMCLTLMTSGPHTFSSDGSEVSTYINISI